MRIAWLPVMAIAATLIGCSPTATESTTPSSQPSPVASTAPSAVAPSSDVAAPAVLVVMCDGTTTDVAIPRVRARPDGVHLRFTNSSRGDLSFSIDEAGGLALLGGSVPATGGEAVETFAIGDYLVTCGGESVPFTVVDPDRAYVSAHLTCPGDGGGSGASGTADYPLGATGPHGSPVEVARLELRGLQPGDVIEPAGYPRAAGDQLVRVVRDGQVIVVLAYLADGSGGWLLGGTSSCAGSDITTEQPD